MSLSSTNEQVVWNNSIYIPTIYKSIRKEDIVEFLEKDFGKVSNIDFVDLNENCRRVFVHFSEWYMDKGFGRIVRHNIETRGFCEFSMPIPNKYRKWFEGKMLINKNPLTPTDRKVKKIRKSLDISFERIHNLDNTVNDLKSKVSYLEDKLEEVLSKYEEPYDDKGPMDISELETDNLENKSKKNKSKLISQGNYNTRIQNMFYDNDRVIRISEDRSYDNTYCGYDTY
jgi:hypothetical protein